MSITAKGGAGATFVASALFFGCSQLLDVSALHEADAGPCPGGAQLCNPFLQCGCPVDENCEVTVVNGTASCFKIGDTTLWGNCKGFGDCPKGAECVDSACKPFCTTSQDCPGAGRLCVQVTSSDPASPLTAIPVTSGDAAIPDVTVCSAGCDLLNPSVVCGVGVTCNPLPWDGQGMDHGDCVGGVEAGIGSGACPGNDSKRCAPGYSCDANSCARWCRLKHKEDCTSRATCTTLPVTPTIGGVQYGLCE